jgi:hypothetical protein
MTCGCLSRTTMVLRVACCVFEVEEGKMCVAFNAKILSEGYEYW